MANDFVPVPCQSAGITTSSAQAKVFTLTDRQYGDCHMNSGKLVLMDTGFGVFEASTFTYHTTKADFWQFYFEVEDAAGTVLFKTDTLSSPAMELHYPILPITWTVRFLFEPAHFPAISKALHFHRC